MAAKLKTKHYYSAHNIATRVIFSMKASVLDSNHYDVDRIFVDLSWELHCWWQLDRVLEQWRSMGRQNARSSTTEVSFCTIIIPLSQCTMAITMV